MDQNGSYISKGFSVKETSHPSNQNDAVDSLPDGNACIGEARENPVPTTSAQVTPSRRVFRDPNKSYFMGHEERGVAIILSHHFHGSEAERKGSQADKDRLAYTFSRLGFAVRTFDDPNFSRIKEILKSVAREEERNRQRDCIAVVVQTHGRSNGRLAASDYYYEVKELWEPFIASNCPSLAGKPKLFFIQACRGCGVDDGVEVTYRGTDVPDSTPDVEFVLTVPSYADLLISYATFEGQRAFRNKANGAWYIQTLCSKLLQHARNMELTTLLTEVQKDVGQKFRSHNENPELHGKVQAPCFLSSLTKPLVFY